MTLVQHYTHLTLQKINKAGCSVNDTRPALYTLYIAKNK